MTTPRIRPELRAIPADDQGIKYFDVSDPQSGAKMRLYDFEWLIASQMDGRRPLTEIAGWARDTLQLDLSSASLSEYVSKLGELGFFAAEGAPVNVAYSPTITARAIPAVPTIEPATSNDPTPPTGVRAMESEDVQLDDPDEMQTVKQEALPPRTQNFAPPPAAQEKTMPRERPQPAPARGPVFKDTRSQTEQDDHDEPARASRSMIGLVVVLVVIAAVVAYVMFAPATAKVSIEVAKPRDVVQLYDGSAKLDKAAPRTMTFGEAGKVVDVVAAGTEVKAGAALATLDSYTKVEKELADVKDRLGFYTKQLEAAGQKGDVAGQKAAEGKVSEKKKALDELEARAAKLRLVAPGPGAVEKVLVAAGADAKADVPAVEFADKRVAAVFKLPAGSTLKAGGEISLQPASGGAVSPGKVSKINATNVTVEIPGDGALKVGDEVRMVKTRLPGVVVVPMTAVVNKGGTDTVFVLAQGMVHAKRVTVADRAGADAYVSVGLVAGDTVVTTGAENLSDGQKAAANP